MPAASTAVALLPITRFVTRHVGGLAVAGGSLAAAATRTRRPECRLRARRNCSSTASAASGVERSSTVGPEAIRSSGSPSTSEMISDTSRPARHARASPPPLMRLSCLRTVLSCSMFAPAALRCRVTASLSASVIASTGAGSRAEPPPESRQRQRSSGPSDSTSRRISAAPADAGGRRLVDARRPGGVQVDPLQRADAIGRHVDPAGKLLFFRQLRAEDFFHGGRHAGARLAGADDDDPPQAAQGDLFVADDQQRPFDVQRFADEPVRADGVKAGMPDGQGVGKEAEGGTRKAELQGRLRCGWIGMIDDGHQQKFMAVA